MLFNAIYKSFWPILTLFHTSVLGVQGGAGQGLRDRRDDAHRDQRHSGPQVDGAPGEDVVRQVCLEEEICHKFHFDSWIPAGQLEFWGDNRVATASTNEGWLPRHLQEENVLHFLKGEAPSLEEVLAAFPPNYRPKPIPLELERIKSISDQDLFNLIPSLTPTNNFKVPITPPAEPGAPQELVAGVWARCFPAVFRAGSVSDSFSAWEELFKGNSWLLGQISRGVGFVLTDSSIFCNPSPKRLRNPAFCYEKENLSFINTEVAALAQKGCVKALTAEEAKNPKFAAFTLPLLVAENSEGKKRLCWNGVYANKFIRKKKFKYETLQYAASLAQKGDFMFTLDLKSGYHQFKLQEDLRKFCCFEWDGTVYQWQVLPFGLCTAPWSFTKIIRCLLQRWRALGYRCSNYIDDFIFFAKTKQEAREIRDVVMKELASLGFVVSPNKAVLEPAQTVTYLGYVIGTNPEVWIGAPNSKLSRIKKECSTLLSDAKQHKTTGRRIASIIGKIMSLRYALPPARIFTRELLDCIRQLPRLEIDDNRMQAWRSFQVHAFRGETPWLYDFDATVQLSPGAMIELLFWVKRGSDWNGTWWKHVNSTPDLLLYTDACGKGWGAAVVKPGLNGRPPQPLTFTQSTFELANSTHSAHTEPTALAEAIFQLGDAIQGQCVRHRTDSLTTFYMVKNGGSRSQILNRLMRRIWLGCLALRVTLQAEYIGSQGIIKAGADTLSRTALDSDLRLKPEVFEQLWDEYGPFVADIFASSQSVHRSRVDGKSRGPPLPFFSNLQQDLGLEHCLGFDAFGGDWATQGVVWVFPPLYSVFKALEKIRKSSGTFACILPDWPSQPWFPWTKEAKTSKPLGRAKDICNFKGVCPVDDVNLWDALSFSFYVFVYNDDGRQN